MKAYCAPNYNPDMIKIPQQPDTQEHIKSLVSDFWKEYQWKNSEKFTASLGMIKGFSKDSSSPAPIKTRNKSSYISFSYQFRPNFTFSFTPVVGFSKSKSYSSPLVIKSDTRALSISLDYKMSQLVTLNFSFTVQNGKNRTIYGGAINENSISNSISQIPGVAFKFSFPAGEKLLLAPDIGLNRVYIKNQGYIDSGNQYIKKKTLTLDQMSLNLKSCFLVNPDVVPYISAGYSKITKYNSNLKSRDSFKGGGGVLLFNGKISFEWTASRSSITTTSNSFTLNISQKF